MIRRWLRNRRADRAALAAMSPRQRQIARAFNIPPRLLSHAVGGYVNATTERDEWFGYLSDLAVKYPTPTDQECKPVINLTPTDAVHRARNLVRYLKLVHDARPEEPAEQLVERAVANIRPTTRRARLILAYRLTTTALTGKRARR